MTKTIKGVLGEKLGMTQVFDASNHIVPVTVVKAGPCVVTQVRSEEKDGYSAVQLAFGAIDPRKVNKPDAGHFAKAGATPRRHVAELRTGDADSYTVGQELGPDVFEAGQIVDVTGTSKGKGFAGVMKRHGFHGLSSSHGVQRKHRMPGSIGACATPGRVFRGLKMAGHMGDKQRTQQNLEVVRTDDERGLIFVKGSVPGSKNGWLLVRDAVKLSRHADAPYPAGLKTVANDATPVVEAAPAVEATEGQEG